MAGLNSTETGNELSQLKLEFTSLFGELEPVSDADGARGRFPGEHPLLRQPGLRLVKVLAG